MRGAEMKHPFVKMIALLSLLTGLAACERQEGEGQAEEVGKNVGERIDSAAQEAGPALERAVDRTSETLREAGEETSDALRSAGNKIGEAMQRGGEKLENESTESAQK
jgi:gas vesicle protein